MPCSLCRNLGIECTYVERKPTKYAWVQSIFSQTLLTRSLVGMKHP